MKKRAQAKRKNARRRSGNQASWVTRSSEWFLGTPGERRPLWLRRGAAAGLLVLAAAGVWGSVGVRQTIRADPRLLVRNWKLELADAPTWVTPEIWSDLSALLAPVDAEDLSVLDPGAIDTITRRLEASPWVRTIQEVRLRYPTREEDGALEVALWLREPVTLVESAGLYYLTDSEGRRLGAPYPDPPPSDWFQVPVLRGLTETSPLPLPGSPWMHRDVHQGVEVARILHEAGVFGEFLDPPIHTVDLTNLHGRVRPGESEISLGWGDRRLAWGRSPLSTGARATTVEDKLKKLRRILAEPDSFREFAEIRLYHSGYITGTHW